MPVAAGIRDEVDKPEVGGGSGPADRQLPAGEVSEWVARPAVKESSDGAVAKKQLSAASMNRLARRIIAQEWARAKGTASRRDGEVAKFEREAADYQRRKEIEKQDAAEALKRANSLTHSLQRSLRVFGFAVAELAPEARGVFGEELLARSLRSMGDVHHIHWRADGCDVTFEPWEERRARRKNRASASVLFQASVDDELRLTGCARLDGAAYDTVRREAILDRILAAMRQQGRTPEALQTALSEVGRVVQCFRHNHGIRAIVEPWEEVRRRRIERRGQEPIKTYVISADAAFENVRCEPVTGDLSQYAEARPQKPQLLSSGKC